MTPESNDACLEIDAEDRIASERRSGWHPDVPSPLDYTSRSPDVANLLNQLPTHSHQDATSVDLREYFPAAPANTQHLASTPAACLALVEYFQGRTMGEGDSYSTMFLEKVTRNMSGASRSASLGIRTTLKAMRKFGVVPQEYWPCTANYRHTEPTAFVYAVSKTLEGFVYFRVDGFRNDGHHQLQSIRAFLQAGFPLVFGTPLPDREGDQGYIPYVNSLFTSEQGQTFVAVGYDNNRYRRGALLVRTNWGQMWGESCYGWLPYDYILGGLAINFWTVLAPSWVASGELFRPSPVAP